MNESGLNPWLTFALVVVGICSVLLTLFGLLLLCLSVAFAFQFGWFNTGYLYAIVFGAGCFLYTLGRVISIGMDLIIKAQSERIEHIMVLDALWKLLSELCCIIIAISLTSFCIHILSSFFLMYGGIKRDLYTMPIIWSIMILIGSLGYRACQKLLSSKTSVPAE